MSKLLDVANTVLKRNLTAFNADNRRSQNDNLSFYSKIFLKSAQLTPKQADGKKIIKE
jgi:hypothetical protein